jgi:hypothetical protein
MRLPALALLLVAGIAQAQEMPPPTDEPPPPMPAEYPPPAPPIYPQQQPPPPDPCCVQPYAPPIVVIQPDTPPPPIFKPRSRGRFLVQLGLSADYLYFMGESFGSFGLTLRAGADGQKISVAASVGVDLGRSGGGLDFEHVHLGTAILGRPTERVRVGVVPHADFFFYQPPSIAIHNGTIWSPGIGADFETSVDVIQDKRGSALVLTLDIGYTWYLMNVDANQGHTVNARLGVAYRF